MNGPHQLEQHVGKLTTSMGAFFPGERVVYRGQDLHTDLKDMDWLELYLFGITGRRFTFEQIRVCHALFTYSSYPDARLWNNRVAALAGTLRSTGTLGIAAGIAISEAQLYGFGPVLRISEFLIRTKKRVLAGEKLEALVRAELKQKRGIPGYGRPIVSADERLAPTMAVLKEQKLDRGPYLQLAFDVEKILLAGRWRLHMNYAAMSAAIAADMGLTAKESYFLGIPGFLGGIPPCFLDAAEKPEVSLFPIPCRNIDYKGVQHRAWKA